MTPQDSSVTDEDMEPSPAQKEIAFEPLESENEKAITTPSYKQDAFGDEEFAEVKYKVLKWWQCGCLMVAETVSLGVLSLPAAVAGLGLVPAIIILVGLGILATYTGYIMGQMKWKYPQITTMADAGEVLAGKIGREFLGACYIVFLVFIMSSHLLTFTVAMNTITEHGTCSIVFGIVGMIVSFFCSLPRTLVNMSWLSLVCMSQPHTSNPTAQLTTPAFASIITAVLISMIALGIEQPGTGVVAIVHTDLYHGFAAVCNIVFAFCGHAAFFGLMAELKNPRDFTKSLCLLQGVDISLYLIAAVVIYRYAGDGVTSPALGSASPVVAKVAYGIALPTVCPPPFAFVMPEPANRSDHHRRRDKRPRRIQIRLRPHLPRHRPHAQARLGGRFVLDWDRPRPLDPGMDYIRRHSGL